MLCFLYHLQEGSFDGGRLTGEAFYPWGFDRGTIDLGVFDRTPYIYTMSHCCSHLVRYLNSARHATQRVRIYNLYCQGGQIETFITQTTTMT